jgi:hypothetical protein
MTTSIRIAAVALCAGLAAASAPAQIIVGMGAGVPPTVSRYTYTGSHINTFTAFFPGFFSGGAHVATGDVTGEGIPDIVAGAGPGPSPQVASFTLTGSPVGSLLPYPSNFTGGVYVATGDINGDGRADIITGAGPGSAPHVKVFAFPNGGETHSFAPFSPSFTGGVRVAAGDINNDGVPDIIAATGPGGTPQVSIFSGANMSLLRSFIPYDPGFNGGVYVASGDIDGDGFADIITGADSGGAPHVRVFSGATGDPILSFFAYTPSFTGGVRVAVADVNGDGLLDIITGPGPGSGPHVKVFTGAGVEFSSFIAGDPSYMGGIFVAAIPAPSAAALFAAAAALASPRRRRR